MFNEKRKYFKAKMDGVKKMLWDREFKVFKLKELRESIRKEFDRSREMVDAFESQSKNESNTEETRKIFTEKVEASKKDVSGMQQQMQELDGEVCNVQKEVEGLHELRSMLKEYMKAGV